MCGEIKLLQDKVAVGYASHTTAKSALDALAKSLALELGPSGIRVNVVAPGLTDTDATAFVPPPVLLCCVDWSRFVTGAYRPVSGGALML